MSVGIPLILSTLVPVYTRIKYQVPDSNGKVKRGILLIVVFYLFVCQVCTTSLFLSYHIYTYTRYTYSKHAGICTCTSIYILPRVFVVYYLAFRKLHFLFLGLLFEIDSRCTLLSDGKHNDTINNDIIALIV